MNQADRHSETRRNFLRQGGAFLGATILMGFSGVLAGALESPEKSAGTGAQEISPAEDLMREHGVLRRVLLIYAEIERRLKNGLSFPVETLAAAAGIIHSFVEDYHEKLEEEHLFPRFRRAGQMVPLVTVLLQQHQAGRRITQYLMTHGTSEGLRNAGNRQNLGKYLSSFIRMYQPHAAWEDTVLFPAFHSLVPFKEYEELGEKFEKQEETKFGEHGFTHIVAEVWGLEKTLGLGDLAQFTPKL